MMEITEEVKHEAKIEIAGERVDGAEFGCFVCIKPSFTPTSLFLEWSKGDADVEHFVTTRSRTTLLLTVRASTEAEANSYARQYADNLTAMLDEQEETW